MGNPLLTASQSVLGIGIDLDEKGVLVNKQFVQVQQHLDVLFLALSAQANLLDDFLGLLAGQTSANVDGLVQNGLGAGGSHLLNVHTALLRCDQDGTL